MSVLFIDINALPLTFIMTNIYFFTMFCKSLSSHKTFPLHTQIRLKFWKIPADLLMTPHASLSPETESVMQTPLPIISGMVNLLLVTVRKTTRPTSLLTVEKLEFLYVSPKLLHPSLTSPYSVIIGGPERRHSLISISSFGTHVKSC